ncbi:MAG: phosphatidate cytidylyltransferase [Phycisphaerales bacterium]
MLSHRLLLGPVFIAVIALLGWLDGAIESAPAPEWLRPLFAGRDTVPPGVVVFLSLLAIGVVGATELGAMARKRGSRVGAFGMALCATLGLVGVVVPPEALADGAGGSTVATGAALTLVVALLAHARVRATEGAMQSVGAAALAFAWLGVAPAFYVLMRREHAVEVVIGAVLLVKVCDIGAYFTGLSIGKRKLIPWLSPGKTWEGLVGGCVWAAVAGALLALAVGDPSPVSPAQAALAGALLGLAGQGADLFESLLKRDAGVKDSGRVPGFGGVLDLIDSPLLAAPVAYWTFHLLGT